MLYKPQWESFWAQLLLHAARLLEMRCLLMGKTAAPKASAFQFTWKDAEAEGCGSCHARYVCQSVLCSSEQMGHVLEMGASSDKGWAHGWSVQSTRLFVGDFAAQAVPQVGGEEVGEGKSLNESARWPFSKTYGDVMVFPLL
jgi:hypothetical protein